MHIYDIYSQVKDIRAINNRWSGDNDEGSAKNGESP